MTRNECGRLTTTTNLPLGNAVSRHLKDAESAAKAVTEQLRNELIDYILGLKDGDFPDDTSKDVCETIDWIRADINQCKEFVQDLERFAARWDLS